MSDQVGNVIHAPGGISVGPYTTDVELLNSTGAGWTQAGVTLKAGQGVLAVGTPLVKESGTSLYVKAAADATVIEGFLRLAVDTGSSDTDPRHLGNLLRSGDAKYSVIKAANDNTDLSSGAIASLNGRRDAIRDSFIF